MGYPRQARLGDIGTDVQNWLMNLNSATSDIQEGTQQLAQKIAGAGNVAVRVSHQVTGAAAGAQAGAQTGGALPVSVSDAIAKIPPPVLYAAGAFILYKLLK